MPQMHLPIFPEGVTHITPLLAFIKKDGKITYFNGHMPVFIHDEQDLQTFRMITGQFIVNGNVKQSQIARVFGLPLITVKRYTKLYREKGPAGFYSKRKGRGPAVLTPEVLEKVQHMLDAGSSMPEIASTPGLLADILSKALRKGRLRQPLKKTKNG